MSNDRPAPTKAAYETATQSLTALALDGTGTTARRACDLILSLIAAEKPRLDLAGLLGYFDAENFGVVMTVLEGFRAHHGWPGEGFSRGEDLIRDLRQLHYADA